MKQMIFLAIAVVYVVGVHGQQNYTERTIVCENGQYINGELQANETEYVNCTTRSLGNREMNPVCQTKIEQRENGNITNTIVWKSCKTEQSCQMNMDQFQERDCTKVEGKPFRICVTCCDSDECNKAVFEIEDGAIDAEIPSSTDEEEINETEIEI